MATLTLSGSGYAEFADGGASWTVTASGDSDTSGTLYARVWMAEHSVPETAHPWFQIETHGVTYQGQALEPPTMDEHGRVCFHLTLTPLPSRGTP